MKCCRKCGVELHDNNWLNSSKHKYDYICRPCRNQKSKLWKEENQQRNYEIYKNYSLKERYGLDLSQYHVLLQGQNHKCKICGDYVETYSRSTHVDHDHKTGKVRGILCNNCNTGIGKFRDDTTILQKAIDYLNENNKY